MKGGSPPLYDLGAGALNRNALVDMIKLYKLKMTRSHGCTVFVGINKRRARLGMSLLFSWKFLSMVSLFRAPPSN